MAKLLQFKYMLTVPKIIMKPNMFRFVRKQFQIFNSIVLFVLNRTNRVFNSFMMNNLFGHKVSTEMFLHNKAVSKNVRIFLSKRMFRFVDIFISITMSSKTFCISISQTFMSKTYLFLCFQAGFAPCPCFANIFPMFFCKNVFLFRHFITSKLKALFRYLKEQRLSYSTLLSAIFKHKKTATLSDNKSIPRVLLNVKGKYRYPSIFEGSINNNAVPA